MSIMAVVGSTSRLGTVTADFAAPTASTTSTPPCVQRPLEGPLFARHKPCTRCHSDKLSTTDTPSSENRYPRAAEATNTPLMENSAPSRTKIDTREINFQGVRVFKALYDPPLCQTCQPATPSPRCASCSAAPLHAPRSPLHHLLWGRGSSRKC